MKARSRDTRVAKPASKSRPGTGSAQDGGRRESRASGEVRAHKPRAGEPRTTEQGAHTSSGERRALSHVGGKVELSGAQREYFGAIEHALAVDSDERSTRAHVHGFHSYPARLHPLTARRLIEGLSAPGDLVLDAFCGSGTVLVEACLLGRRAAGVDINPIAIELARFKVTASSAAERDEWLTAAERVAEYAEERRQDRAGPTRLYRPHEREPYDPHMLFELDGLSAGIAREDGAVRRVLRLILSSILTKVSKSPGDTSERRLKRRLASGFAIRTFAAKAVELVAQHAAYSAALPKLNTRSPRALVIHGDARRLPRIEPMSVDLVVSSPPYPGVFDYLQHHEARLQWLGLDGGDLARNEIGSRRQLSRMDPEEALYRWQGDLRAVLRALARVLKPRGKAALVLADTALKLMPVYADDLLAELAPSAGLTVLAVGSQLRPHFHAPTLNAFKRRARREHLILLGPLPRQARRDQDRTARSRPASTSSPPKPSRPHRAPPGPKRRSQFPKP